MMADDRFGDDATLAAAGRAIAATGWCRLQLDAPGLLDACRSEVLALGAGGDLLAASTGRRGDRQQAGLRGDSTLWLDDPACGPAAAALLAALDALRQALDRHLMLGLHETQAHCAIYPAGASYDRHRDHFQDRDDDRLLSLVLYLNRDWPDDAGGALRLHLATGTHDIAPRQGTVAVFLSAEVEHEVLPATRPRLSVAAWFRRRA